MSNIKSLSHFNFYYFNEPYDVLNDEASIEVWNRKGSTKLAENEIPYDVEGVPKFGYRCAYVTDNTNGIWATDSSKIFSLSPKCTNCQ